MEGDQNVAVLVPGFFMQEVGDGTQVEFGVGSVRGSIRIGRRLRVA